MMVGISNIYEDAGNFMAYDGREGGYLGTTFSPDELIHDQIGLDTDPFELSEDIVNSIDDISWAEPNMYYGTERDELWYKWDFFKNQIKHESRYIYQNNKPSTDNAYSILKAAGKIINQLGVKSKIDKGTIVYRCRQHESGNPPTEKSKLVAPKNEDANYPNRFSPSGISMLYSAFDPVTAILETINPSDKKKNMITTAKFKLKKDIYVVDLNKLPPKPSVFDFKKIKNYYLIRFLHDFVKDITKEIEKDGKEHIEYVPTQVVTEYFRYPFNKNRQKIIEGIIYPSSKNKLKTSSVLFWNNAECMENLELVEFKVEGIKTFTIN